MAEYTLTSIDQPVPELPVADVVRAQEHYRDKLGFDISIFIMTDWHTCDASTIY